MVDKNNEKLWKEYAKTKSQEIKDTLIVEYAPLVKYVAGRLNMYLGQNVEYDDLIGNGIFGLIDAIEKYDINKGVKFETYASLRIRGAIIDSIRKFDWVPRSLRQKQKELKKTYLEMENKLGRSATDQEMAEQLGMDLKQYYKLLSKTSVVSLISLEEYTEQNAGTVNITDINSSEQPENIIENNELIEVLADSIDKLPEKEKTVITLYYYEELTLKEISVVLGVSESRISQLHSKAILRLKSILKVFI